MSSTASAEFVPGFEWHSWHRDSSVLRHDAPLPQGSLFGRKTEIVWNCCLCNYDILWHLMNKERKTWIDFPLACLTFSCTSIHSRTGSWKEMGTQPSVPKHISNLRCMQSSLKSGHDKMTYVSYCSSDCWHPSDYPNPRNSYSVWHPSGLKSIHSCKVSQLDCRET